MIVLHVRVDHQDPVLQMLLTAFHFLGIGKIFAGEQHQIITLRLVLMVAQIARLLEYCVPQPVIGVHQEEQLKQQPPPLQQLQPLQTHVSRPHYAFNVHLSINSYT